MRFQIEEVIFYAVVLCGGSCGGLIRLWRDGEHLDLRRACGRCFSSGLLGFGVVGLWIGRTAGDVSGPFYFVAVAALIGYMSSELQDKILSKLISSALRRAGLVGDEPAQRMEREQPREQPREPPSE